MKKLMIMLGLIMLNLTACSPEPLPLEVDCHGIHYYGTFTGKVTDKGLDKFGGYISGTESSNYNFWIELDYKAKVYVKQSVWSSKITPYNKVVTITAVSPKYLCE